MEIIWKEHLRVRRKKNSESCDWCRIVRWLCNFQPIRSDEEKSLQLAQLLDQKAYLEELNKKLE